MDFCYKGSTFEEPQVGLDQATSLRERIFLADHN